MSGLKPRPTWERWRRQEKQRQKQIPCGNGKLEGQEQKQKTNTGVSPLRRKSAPPVEMTEFGARLGEHTSGAKARVVVGLDVWAEGQTYLEAMAKKPRRKQIYLWEWELEEQRQKQKQLQVQKQIPFGNGKLEEQRQVQRQLQRHVQKQIPAE